MFPARAVADADVATITATRCFFDALATALNDDVVQIELALAALAEMDLDQETFADLQSTQDDARRAAARCRATIAVLDATHRQLEEAVNLTRDAARTDFYRGTVAVSGRVPSSIEPGASPTGRPHTDGSQVPGTTRALCSPVPRAPAVRGLDGPCPTATASGCPGRLGYRVGGGLACRRCGADAGAVGLVDEPTDAAGITAFLRGQFGLTSPRSTTPPGLWIRLAMAADEPWMPRSVTTVLLGIDWARGRGWLPVAADTAIGALTDWQLCALVGELAAACHTQNDVPVYLARKYRQ